MGHIFVSYSHKDREFAHKLEDALQEHRFEVWIDDRIDYGSKWPKVIQENLDRCDAFVVIVSENSSKSDWVEKEVARAQRKEKPFFPILLSGEPWLSIETTQYVDLKDGSLPPMNFYTQLATVIAQKKLEADLLWGEAQQLELSGKLEQAITKYYEVKQLDPLYPEIDQKIDKLEEELEQTHQKRQVWPWKEISKYTLILLIFILTSLFFLIALFNSTPNPFVVKTPTSTISPVPLSTSTNTNPPPASCPNVQVSYLEFILPTESRQRKYPDTEGNLVLSRDELGTLTSLTGRAVLKNADGCSCEWSGSANNMPARAINTIPAGQCGFNIGLPEQIAKIDLILRVGSGEPFHYMITIP